MSTRKERVTAETDDLADAPYLDDAERAESAWLLAREADPSAPAPSPEAANDYAQLEAWLGDLLPGLPDDSWHDEVLRKASAPATPPRSWWRRPVAWWAMGGAFAAASAAAVLLLVLHVPDELEVAILHGEARRSVATDVVIGDHLVVTARPDGPGELRVYRAGGTLVARCPSGPGCRSTAHGEYTIDFTLDAPVQYRVVLVVGTVDAPIDASMDAYMGAARAAKAHIVTYGPVNVN